MENNSPSVIIIGAGPAGLAVAGCLRAKGLDFVMLEQGEGVGESWRRHYDRLHLHTVKELSHLPGLPFPDAYPRYVSRDQLVAYMENYADHFDIRPLFGQAVRKIYREGGGWKVECASGQSWESANVILAMGLNRRPFIPEFNGLDTFAGEVLHSSRYRNAGPFKGKKVLVVGMGNSGAEIALDLCEQGVETALSVRGPVNIVPRDVLGRPTQLTALALAKLPPWLGDRLGVLLRAITVGDLSRYGIKTPDMPPAQQLRETGQTPVIDLGTLKQIRSGNIKVFPAIERIAGSAIHFADGTSGSFDGLLLATGFRPDLEDFLGDTKGLLDEHGCPVDVIGTGNWGGLYFVGFDNYITGGILGAIRRDAVRVAGHLAGQI